MKYQRLRMGLSQKEVAMALNLSQPYMSQLESYAVPAPPEILSRLSMLYKVPIKDLFPSSHC